MDLFGGIGGRIFPSRLAQFVSELKSRRSVEDVADCCNNTPENCQHSAEQTFPIYVFEGMGGLEREEGVRGDVITASGRHFTERNFVH